METHCLKRARSLAATLMHVLLKGGVHISAHVRESKCFFIFLINFMALKISLTCTSVITFYNNISPSKMTDDQNSQKMLVDCTHKLSILN